MPSSFNYSPTPTAGSVTATASGKLSDGSKVILNSNGTVSVIVATGSSTLLSKNNAVGTGTVYPDDRCVASAYDSTNDVIVNWYINNADQYLYAIASKIINGIITFGSPVAIASVALNTGFNFGLSAAYDPINNYHHCIFKEFGNSPAVGGWANCRATGTTITAVNVNSSAWANGSYTSPQGWTLIISPILNGADQQVLITYHAGNIGQQIYQVCKMNGSNITFGTDYVLSASTNTSPRLPCFVTASVAAIPYKDTSNYAAISIVTLSNTTGTINNQTVLDSTSTSNTTKSKAVSYNATTGNLFCVFTASTNTRGVLFTLSGTTPTIGTVVNITGSSPASPLYCVAYPPTNEFWFGNNNDAYRIIPSGTTFTVGSQNTFTTVGASYFGTLLYNPANYALTLSATATPQISYGVGYTSTLNSNNFLGISSASYGTGSAATIQIIGSVDDAQSGLTAGTDYFVSPSGALDSAGTSQPYAGLALSSTRLLIKG